MPGEPEREREDEGAVAVLVDNHRQFLAFLQKRVGSREDAEEILQAAFVKSLEKGETIREDESTVAWFYRVRERGEGRGDLRQRRQRGGARAAAGRGCGRGLGRRRGRARSSSASRALEADEDL